MRIQSGVNLEILHDAIRTHLEDYGHANQGTFGSGWSEPGVSTRLVNMDFWHDDESTLQPTLDLGKVRLRWLGEHLTEIRFVDSQLLTSTPDELMQKWEYDLEEVSDDEKALIVKTALEKLKIMHGEVRRFLLERLKEDQLLGDQRPMASRLNRPFVDPVRIGQLRKIRSDKFDLARVIQICDELNLCFNAQCLLATGVLVRALIDHVPPIFGVGSFTEVANNVGGKSVKASLRHLEITSRNIADSILHQQIRSREVLPAEAQVNFSNDLDVLLSEVLTRLL